jgi:hypothetical protein
MGAQQGIVDPVLCRAVAIQQEQVKWRRTTSTTGVEAHRSVSTTHNQLLDRRYRIAVTTLPALLWTLNTSSLGNEKSPECLNGPLTKFELVLITGNS